MIFVTTLLERPQAEITRMPTRSHVTELVTGIAGVLAASVGLWMYYVPTDWFLGGLAEGWYLGMFIAAGLLLGAAFGLYAWKALAEDRSWTFRVTTATVLAVLAVGGAVTFGLIWLL